jgi:acyl carrier protein
MGLDSVQIIVDTEKCFGIEINDQAAEKMRTVGELVDYVWGQIEHNDPKACLTQILFFRLRSFFTSNFNIAPIDFKPETHLSVLGTKKELDAILPQLKAHLKLEIPTVFTGEKVLFFFSTHSDTVHDLIDSIIYKNIEELRIEHGITKETVLAIVASITHNITGAPKKDIIPTANFVEDLGVS